MAAAATNNINNNAIITNVGADDDDDNVASFVQPRSPQTQMADADVAYSADELMSPPVEVAPENRPNGNVKACKNICVIFAHDVSGSMESSRKMIADGTNEFVQDLQMRYSEPCEYNARFCLITFSGETIVVGEWTDIHSTPVFCANSFKCNGTTPLWDACETGLDKMESDCVDIVSALYVFTDGEDNSSTNANRGAIGKRIMKLNPLLHTMLFIGSDPLSAANAASIGVTRTKSLNPSSDNTPSAMRACTNAIARCVTGETQTPEFNKSDIAMSEGSSAHSYDMFEDGGNNGDDACMQTPAIGRARSNGGGRW